MKCILLFPQCKDQLPTMQDVTEEIKQWEADLEQALKVVGRPKGYWISAPIPKFPQHLIDPVRYHGRKGYLKYKNEWYVYRSCCNEKKTPQWTLIGSKAKKIPPFVMELYINAYGGGLTELLLDPNPKIRSAALKYHKRYKRDE